MLHGVSLETVVFAQGSPCGLGNFGISSAALSMFWRCVILVPYGNNVPFFSNLPAWLGRFCCRACARKTTVLTAGIARWVDRDNLQHRTAPLLFLKNIVASHINLPQVGLNRLPLH
jgi:hypothetical protein